jgi:hypothetical protein
MEEYGNLLLGDELNDLYGYSIALNAEGNILAVGSPGSDLDAGSGGLVRVYKLEGDTWTQMGQDLTGAEGGEQCGVAVDLNYTGSRIAVGCPYSNGAGQTVFAGRVQVFEWDGTAWTDLGAPILGMTSLEESGANLSLDNEGNTIAISSPCYSAEFSCSGLVRVFELENSEWIQKGNNFESLSGLFTKYGENLALSGDGFTLAISSNRNSFPYDTLPAFAQVFRWQEESWTQYGETYFSEEPNRYSGMDVALSEDGSTLSISDCYSNHPFNNIPIPRGEVKVFSLIDNQLIQKGETINNFTNGYEGLQTEMSLDGNTLFISSSIFQPPYAYSSGKFHFVEWTETGWVSEEFDPDYGVDFFQRSQRMNGFGSVVVTADHIFGHWPNEGHGAVQAFSTPTLNSIERDNLINHFKLFPNPAAGKEVSVALNLKGKVNLIIRDITGKIIAQQTIQPGYLKFNIEGFAPGIYYCTIFNSSIKATRKLVIQP